MENIIEKLKQIKPSKRAWADWSLEEVRALFEIYFVISKKEAQIFDLIYQYHGCDSWEDIFRDYNPRHLKDKADGVEVAINEITERMQRDAAASALGDATKPDLSQEK
jgi:hypothetical protein